MRNYASKLARERAYKRRPEVKEKINAWRRAYRRRPDVAFRIKLQRAGLPKEVIAAEVARFQSAVSTTCQRNDTYPNTDPVQSRVGQTGLGGSSSSSNINAHRGAQ